ncbi:MAG: YlmC/YmxH family sporulation protein [Oscillospiraceae bacterium]|nr:YlmC/YmxH family sporulation protein [Oscillospiraceae bacterium]MDD3261623.1 YlmC/YmxH family sporulation protein [Oscillospiraceae bacterium]
MHSRVYDLHRKEVINIRDGVRLGNVGDVEIDTVTASVAALVIYGRLRFFGLFGREDDRMIPWADIRLIGEDIILVDTLFPQHENRQHSRTKAPPVKPEKETPPKKA